VTRNTRPLREVAEDLEDMPPMTRFRTAAEALGWLKTTYSLRRPLNCCQLMIAHEDWLIWVVSC